MPHGIFIRNLINVVQSLIILGVMAAIFAAIGLVVAGVDGILLAIVMGMAMLLLGFRFSPVIVLRMYNARKLMPEEAPGLYRVLGQLAGNAGLASVPGIYYVPSSIMNAFSVGRKERAAIALTDGLLRNMNWDEMAGILAHEMGHIEHNDLWVMGLADSMSRFTYFFSIIGFLMLVLYLPAILLGFANVPFWTILVIFLAPHASMLLQLALSRTREYDADLNAVRLTGNSEGLASALSKMDNYPLKIWDFIFFPGSNAPAPSILRTHPYTRKRIERLINLANKGSDHGVRAKENPQANRQILPNQLTTVTRKPRRGIWGIWH